jgi:uncharacterized membrane protein
MPSSPQSPDPRAPLEPHPQVPPSSSPAHRTSRSITTGLLIGVGVAAFIDETVFHQLLHWHHFYDKSTPDVGLMSDGIFHAGGFLAIVTGLFMFADLQRRHATSTTRVVGAAFLGWGTFQLYDGLIQHKVFKLHEIRYGVDLLPYDLTWDSAAVLGLVIGVTLLARQRARDARQTASR